MVADVQKAIAADLCIKYNATSEVHNGCLTVYIDFSYNGTDRVSLFGTAGSWIEIDLLASCIVVGVYIFGILDASYTITYCQYGSSLFKRIDDTVLSFT